jgi:hypothetical protein
VRSPKVTDNDDLIVRKLKAGNYGKWFMRPDDFNRRIDKLNLKIKNKLEDSSML